MKLSDIALKFLVYFKFEKAPFNFVYTTAKR